jgi:hypothetical protein
VPSSSPSNKPDYQGDHHDGHDDESLDTEPTDLSRGMIPNRDRHPVHRRQYSHGRCYGLSARVSLTAGRVTHRGPLVPKCVLTLPPRIGTDEK